MCSVNERIDKLRRETADLRKEVKDLKGNWKLSCIFYFDNIFWIFTLDTILQQNELIINLLSKQNGMLEDNIEADKTLPQVSFGKRISEFYRRFPLETIEDMDQFERDINEDNKSNIVSYIV